MVTLQQLRYFRELAANGHLTHTAEKLHITQTSLSNTIIHLEKELGVRLFRRVGRSLELSEIGEAYLRYVEEGLSSLDNGLTVVDDYLNRGNNSVSIAMSSSHVWTTLIRNFRTEYRDYSIRQVNCTRLQYRDLLISQEDMQTINLRINEVLSGLEMEVLQAYLDGQSYQEIAERLGRHVKSIDNALQRVKRKLSRYLQERDQE